MALFKKILKWAGIILLLAFLVLVGFRLKYHIDLEKTNEQVAKIHATKLTLDDVMGKNLPPDPGEAADDTVAGIDVNTNGIRDDVELAIFKVYPNSPKTRAPLLQYALSLQMEFTQPFINKGVVTAVAEEWSRAGDCVADSLVPRKSPESSRVYKDIEKINSYTDFVEKIHLNTSEREDAQTKFYEGKLGSFTFQDGCDVDASLLK